MSAVTADTLNFVTAFSNMALGETQASPARGAGGAGGPVRAKESGKTKGKNKDGKAVESKGIQSGEAQGAAAAAPEAGL